MLHVALWEPEIPPNTGNIARLCAATNATLHLIGRLGFRTDDRSLRRAGCDYWPHVRVVAHATADDFAAALGDARVWCVETGGGERYCRVRYRAGDCLLFGSESRGLPADILARHAATRVHIPMPGEHVRSINLSNAVALVTYEALKQLHDW